MSTESADATKPVSVAADLVLEAVAIAKEGAAADVADSTASTVLKPGEWLKQAREQAGLSIADVANRLRMGVGQIDALEQAKYAALPTGTFLRGFIRNYAKALGLDGQYAIQLLEKTHSANEATKAPTIVVPSHNIRVIPEDRFSAPRVRILLGAFLLVVVAGATGYWWQFVRPHLAAGGYPPVVEPPKPEALSVVPPMQAEEPQTNAPPSSALPAIDQNEAIAAVNALPSAANGKPELTIATPPLSNVSKLVAPSVQSADKGNVLGFTFSGESWVEVIDGRGKTLVSKRYQAGDADEISGQGPFSVVIGNAQATRMAFNGREFDLTPHTRVSVARLTIK